MIVTRGRYRIRCEPLFIAPLIVVLLVATVSAQEIDVKALKIIAEWTENFCDRVPLQGSGSTLEFSGQAKAEIVGLVKKLTDIGIQGMAKYHLAQYEGFLQKDLLEATRDRAKCKREALNFLTTNFLSPGARQYVLPPTVRDELAQFVLDGVAIRQRWLSNRHRSNAEQEAIAKTIVPWHERVEKRLAQPPMGPQYVARFKNQIGTPFGIFDNFPVKLGGLWQLLHSDLQRLDEFMKER